MGRGPRRRPTAWPRACSTAGLADRPVMILSGNSRLHLTVTLAAMTVGAPVVPISVAYSLQSADHAKLRAMVDLVDPGLVVAEDAAFAARGRRRWRAGARSSPAATSSGSLTPEEFGADRPTRSTGAAPRCAATTSRRSSSPPARPGTPKGVVNTHGMLAANQQQMRQVWPFLADEPPVLLDWLPWSHTFGGNHDLNMVLTNGGTLWIDDGRPAPALIERTVAQPRRRRTRRSTSTCLPATPPCCPHLERRRRAPRRPSSSGCGSDSSPRPRCPSSCGTGYRAAGRRARLADADDDVVGADRDVAGRDLRALPDHPQRLARRPAARRRARAGPGGREDRGARARAQRHPGLPPPSRPDRGRVRRGRLLPHRRRRGARRPGRPRGRAASSAAASPRTSSSPPAPSSASAPCDRSCSRRRRACSPTPSSAARTATASPRWCWLQPDHAAPVSTTTACPTTACAPTWSPPWSGSPPRAADRRSASSGCSCCTSRPQLDAGEITDKGYVNQRAVRERRADAVALLAAEPCPPQVVQRRND